MIKKSLNLFFVFCLAGHGKRFTDKGINTPKYLLSFSGDRRTILEETIKNFRFEDDVKVIFCCNKKHIDSTSNLQEIISKNKLNADMLFVEDTLGQAHTAYIASKHINSKYKNYSTKPIVFFNGDTILKNRDLKKLTKKMEDSNGLIDCFISKDSKYSFIKVDQNNYVIDIEEKICISNKATSGLYFFSSPVVFMQEFINGGYMKSKTETYISFVYKSMIEKNMKIKFHEEIDKENTIVLGTPEEYMHHLDSHE